MSDLYPAIAEMSDDERRIKENYVNEYLKDFNEVQAAHRIGVEKRRVNAFVKKMLKDTYAIALVREKMRTMDEAVVVTRSEILNNLKHIAMTSPNDDVRMKAWYRLAKLMGMEVLHVKTQLLSGDTLPDIDGRLSTEELATIYNDEVING